MAYHFVGYDRSDTSQNILGKILDLIGAVCRGDTGFLVRGNVGVPSITGANGGVYITSARNAVTPTAPNTAFQAIVVTQQAVIAAIAGNITNISDVVGATLLPGQVLYGRFTSVTLTSGAVIAYNA